MNHGIRLPISITDSSTEAIESVEINRSPDEADHPITGGVEPAIPPITMFCGVLLFSQMLY